MKNPLIPLQISEKINAQTLKKADLFIRGLSCNLVEIADKAHSWSEKGTQASSTYKNMLRLFQTEHRQALTDGFVGALLKPLRRIPAEEPLVCLMDRTNGKRGEHEFNFLTLGVVLAHKVFVPVLFDALPKAGNSNTAERKGMMERFYRLMGRKNLILLADREFVGEEWFDFLLQSAAGFVIRIRRNQYLKQILKLMNQTEEDFFKENQARLQSGKPVALEVEDAVSGRRLKLVVVKNRNPQKDDQYLYLLTTLESGKRAAALYALRWRIESAFKHLKSGGFCWEKLNLKDKTKVELFVSALFLVFFVVCKAGIDILKHTRRRYKRYNNGQTYPAASVFKQGYALLSIYFHKRSEKLDSVFNYYYQCITLNFQFDTLL